MKRRNSLLYSGIILYRRQVLDSINGVLKVKILRDQTKKKLRGCLNVQKSTMFENHYIGTFFRQKKTDTDSTYR